MARGMQGICFLGTKLRQLDLGLALGGHVVVLGGLKVGAKPTDEAAVLLLGALVVEGDETLENLP